MIKLFFRLVILLPIISGCAPKVTSNQSTASLASNSIAAYEPFAIIEVDTINRADHFFVGQIEVKDAGLTLNCGYETILELAKKEALKLGGNSIIITEHRKPNQWSTCHRIKADVMLMKNVRMYEKEILWHPKRKLEVSDFKGSIVKRPFIAATMSSFRYRVEGRPAFPNRYKITVETFFDCYSSYFKHTANDSITLLHEQLHFDISELYARKYLRRIKEEVKDLNELLEKKDILLDEVSREHFLKQDEYDAEVYADPAKQSKWNKLIAQELIDLNEFTAKVLQVKKEK